MTEVIFPLLLNAPITGIYVLRFRSASITADGPDRVSDHAGFTGEA